MRTVLVVDYDPRWPEAFEELRAAIWSVVRDIALAVEHAGSIGGASLRGHAGDRHQRRGNLTEAGFSRRSNGAAPPRLRASGQSRHRWPRSVREPGRPAETPSLCLPVRQRRAGESPALVTIADACRERLHSRNSSPSAFDVAPRRDRARESQGRVSEHLTWAPGSRPALTLLLLVADVRPTSDAPAVGARRTASGMAARASPARRYVSALPRRAAVVRRFPSLLQRYGPKSVPASSAVMTAIPGSVGRKPGSHQHLAPREDQTDDRPRPRAADA